MIILFALLHPGLVAAVFAILFATQMVVVKFIAVAMVFVLKYVFGLIIGGLLTWYLGALFMLHVWPKLPEDLRRDLLKLKDRMLFAPKDETSNRDDK